MRKPHILIRRNMWESNDPFMKISWSKKHPFNPEEMKTQTMLELAVFAELRGSSDSLHNPVSVYAPPLPSHTLLMSHSGSSKHTLRKQAELIWLTWHCPSPPPLTDYHCFLPCNRLAVGSMQPSALTLIKAHFNSGSSSHFTLHSRAQTGFFPFQLPP